MSIFTSFDPTPLSNSLQGSVSELITQPQLININKSSVLEVYQEGSGSSKKKKASPKTLPKTLSKTLPKKKLIDTYTKESLVKIAKKHDVSLKARDGSIKTKKQLFDSLKRKDLI